MSVENTSKRDPAMHLLGLLVQGNDGYIMGMERTGQLQLVASTKFPVDRSLPAEEWEALGFTFSEPDPEDPLFCDATFPEGWAREASDHDMWSYVCDETGARRVAVFYKAAFYDRRAFARIEHG